jgi:hypothetical protein
MEEIRRSQDRDPGEPSAATIVRALVKDLAELAQAQASLTKDMVRLLDLLNEEKEQTPREVKGGVAEAPPPRAVEIERPAPPVPATPTAAPVPAAPTAAAVPVAPTASAAQAAPIPPAAPAAAMEPPHAALAGPQPIAPARIDVPPRAVHAPPEPRTAPPPVASAPVAAAEPIEYTVTSEEDVSSRIAAGMQAQDESAEDAADLAAEGPDEMEGSESPDATVLVLESGDARVGVLWDQVVQVGSLTTPTVPPRIETERGQTDLVSLGLLLHGVSREEKYFVVLEQEGERAAVACERMLGLGPLNSASKDDKETRIQVLRVPLLRSFAKEAQVGAARSKEARYVRHPRPDDEERDRNGPLRALVAVRYLPARVAICRHLRGCGWQVGEAAGLEAANVSLDLGRWDVLFLEVRNNGDTEETETTILKRVAERGIPVIRVGSRLSGFPQQEGPAVMFPFAEAELDTILIRIGEHASRK